MSLNYCELLSVGQWKETAKRPWKGQMFMMQLSKRGSMTVQYNSSVLIEATRQEKAHRLSIVERLVLANEDRSSVRGHLLLWLPLFKLPDFYEGTLVCSTVEKRSWFWVVSQIIKCLTKTSNAIWSAEMRLEEYLVSISISPLSISFVFWVNVTSWEPTGGKWISLDSVSYLYALVYLWPWNNKVQSHFPRFKFWYMWDSLKMEHWTFNNSFTTEGMTSWPPWCISGKICHKRWISEREESQMTNFPMEIFSLEGKGKKMSWSQWQIAAF